MVSAPALDLTSLLGDFQFFALVQPLPPSPMSSWAPKRNFFPFPRVNNRGDCRLSRPIDLEPLLSSTLIQILVTK